MKSIGAPRNVVVLCVLLTLSGLSLAQDPLPSWNDGVSRKSIVSFVERVTKEDSLDFLEPGECIALIDKGWTLWCEQPACFQLLFESDRVRALASEHPEWKEKVPFESNLIGEINRLT